MIKTTNAIIMKFISSPRKGPQLITMGPIARVAVFQAPPGIKTVIIGMMMLSMVHLYTIDVLKHLNFSSFLKVHFDSVIPASLAGVFLHSTPLSSLYLNPP